MADLVMNIAKGAWAEKIRDSAANLGILLLKTAEADATLKTRATVAAILANGSTEADFTNYSRKTGLTGSLTVDNSNHRVDADVADQTWTSAGGASNNTLAKLIIFYEDTAADSGRVPISAHDFVATTDGSDLTAQINSAGFARAS